MRKKCVRIVLIILLFLVAVLMTAYPYIANFVFEHRNNSVVNTIEQNVDGIAEAEKQKALNEAQSYNRSLLNGHIQLKDPFESEVAGLSEARYDSLLNINGDGVMGLVDIPAIDVKLPIYHSTSEEVLEKGVGHLEGTSLPVGGEGTHSVLTGHTGLSNAKLFTDLIEMEEGDYFFITVLGEKLAYKVDKISTVLPNELNDLYPVKGMDICTLVTCTPYGINTHRLLVRGTRTDFQEAVSNPEVLKKKNLESTWMYEYKRALLISMGCFAVGMTFFLGFHFHKSRNSGRRKQ